MIIHVDMDAFYAAIEERDHPELRGKPLIVGGSENQRGVVSAANYPARRFGIHSAMPTATAIRRCPQLIRIPGRMDHYAEVSRQIHAIFARYTPLIEPLSLDEAFLDVEQSQKIFGNRVEIAKRIVKDIARELELVASVGIAPNKYLAKIASDLEKPNGFVVVDREQTQSFLDPLPVSRLWGVGQAGQKTFTRLGIKTIGQVRRMNQSALQDHFGSRGLTLWQLANGIDQRRIQPDREAKSISNEITFATDITGHGQLLTCLLRLTEHVAFRLRAAGLACRTIQIKARFPDFRTITRSYTLDNPSHDTQTLWLAVKTVAEKKLDLNRPYRLLGVGISQLTDQRNMQQDLFNGPEQAKIDATSDAIKRRFGQLAIYRAGHQKRGASSDYIIHNPHSK